MLLHSLASPCKREDTFLSHMQRHLQGCTTSLLGLTPLLTTAQQHQVTDATATESTSTLEHRIGDNMMLTTMGNKYEQSVQTGNGLRVYYSRRSRYGMTCHMPSPSLPHANGYPKGIEGVPDRRTDIINANNHESWLMVDDHDASKVTVKPRHASNNNSTQDSAKLDFATCPARHDVIGTIDTLTHLRFREGSGLRLGASTRSLAD